MRLTPSDPDIETLLRRIDNNDIDLQPDFQRGEVWGEQKQKRLIDTILRGWYIPPIHVIEYPDQRLEVLDGQQRLVAIRDFYKGLFKFDGSQPPYSDHLSFISNLGFAELPDKFKLKFLRFPIRQYTIHDFQPGEPAELFFRLNQQVALSAAEQRNAFFGPVRDQVHRLAARLGSPDLGKASFGFGNSRMAYDDVIARVCRTLEKGSLSHKITASDLSDRYRSVEPFSSDIEIRLNRSIDMLGSIVRGAAFEPVRFNKTVLYSWLVFLSELTRLRIDDELGECLIGMYRLYVQLLDVMNEERSFFGSGDEIKALYGSGLSPEFLRAFSWVYVDRSTSRVSDVLSVVYRDIFLWTLLYLAGGRRKEIRCRQFDILRNMLGDLSSVRGFDDLYESAHVDYSWDIGL